MTYMIGDAHIYNNHIDKTKEMLSRQSFPSPILRISGSPKEDLAEYTAEDIHLSNYKYHPAISAEVAV